MEECQQLYLMSGHCTAPDTQLSISFMEGYYQEQVIPDYHHDPKKWWEVMDRTTQRAVPTDVWEVDREKHQVLIMQAEPFHEYTVSFLVYAIWDPTQMYNHITNDWGDKPHEIPFDVRHEMSGNFAREYLVRWLKENPSTDVVRFTTFFYHFTLVFNHHAKEKFVDWFGYGATVSVKALEEFEKNMVMPSVRRILWTTDTTIPPSGFPQGSTLTIWILSRDLWKKGQGAGGHRS